MGDRRSAGWKQQSWKSPWRFSGAGVAKVVEQIELGDGEKPLPDRGSGLDVDCVRSRPGLAVWAIKLDGW